MLELWILRLGFTSVKKDGHHIVTVFFYVCLLSKDELSIFIEWLAVYKDFRVRPHIADHVPVDRGFVL